VRVTLAGLRAAEMRTKFGLEAFPKKVLGSKTDSWENVMKPKKVEWKAADWNKMAEGGAIRRIFVNVVKNTFLICKN